MGDAEQPLWKAVAAGGTGGIGLTLVGHPFETIKTRLQTGQSKNLFRGLFSGLMSPLCGITPFFAASYTGYRTGYSICGTNAANAQLHERLLATTLAAAFSTIVRTPVDTVKIVAQVDGLSSGEALRRVVATGGPTAVYRGVVPTFGWLLPSSTAFYLGYEFFNDSVFQDTNPSLRPFLAGGMAGVGEWTLCLPFDTIKTRYQASAGVSLVDCMRSSVSELGVLGLYRGFIPVILRAFPANAAAFWGIETTNRLLKDL